MAKKVKIAWARSVLNCAAVTREIQSVPRRNANDIARNLKMVPRSVHRIIAELRAFGAPLPFVPGARWIEFSEPWDFYEALKRAVEKELDRPTPKPRDRRKKVQIDVAESATVLPCATDIPTPAELPDSPPSEPLPYAEVVEFEESVDEEDYAGAIW